MTPQHSHVRVVDRTVRTVTTDDLRRVLHEAATEPLAVAQADLQHRRHALDAASDCHPGEWSLLSALEDVVDYTRRVADVPDQFYRREKVRLLVEAAIAAAIAVYEPNADDERRYDAVYELGRALRDGPVAEMFEQLRDLT